MKKIIQTISILIIFSACSSVRKTEIASGIHGLESAKTISDIKKSIPFKTEWEVQSIDGLYILFGITPSYGMITSGEAYYDIYGYVYNRSFKEWRKFCHFKTRYVFKPEIGIDKGIIYLIEKANNPSMQGKKLLQIDTDILSDNRCYLDNYFKERLFEKDLPPPPDLLKDENRKIEKSNKKASGD